MEGAGPGVELGQQVEEIRKILLGLVNTIGEVKGQVSALGDVNRKLDDIGDIAKAAKGSTDSAHKRLDEIRIQVEEMAKSAATTARDSSRTLEIIQEVRSDHKELEKKVGEVEKVANAANTTATSSKERLDKLDGRLWAVILAIIALMARTAWDMVTTSGGAGP